MKPALFPVEGVFYLLESLRNYEISSLMSDE